jgi:hypothetical protein
MEQKIKDMKFDDLDVKFAKRKFNRSKVVVNRDPAYFLTIFMSLYAQCFFTVPINVENRLLYTSVEMNQFDKKKSKKELSAVDVFRSVIFIIAKLGYSPFKKFSYIFLKDEDEYSYYFDVSVFSKQNLNFFNYLLGPHIYDFLETSEPNNFCIRLENAGLKVTKGRSFLFNKSYITSNKTEEIIILSSNVSQLRNYLYAVENNKVDLLNKIDLKNFNKSFIDFELKQD